MILESAATHGGDPRSKTINWPEEPAIHDRCFACPGCGVSEIRPGRAAGRTTRRRDRAVR
jgi:hypothetical protein